VLRRAMRHRIAGSDSKWGGDNLHASYPLPSSSVGLTVTATSATDSSKSISAALIPVGNIPGYDVGVDYHAYGTDTGTTAFITTYDQLQVRQTVQQQLQGMADRGATSIQTAIWIVTEPGMTDFGQTWRTTFPMTDREAATFGLMLRTLRLSEVRAETGCD